MYNGTIQIKETTLTPLPSPAKKGYVIPHHMCKPHPLPQPYDFGSREWVMYGLQDYTISPIVKDDSGVEDDEWYECTRLPVETRPVAKLLIHRQVLQEMWTQGLIEISLPIQ